MPTAINGIGTWYFGKGRVHRIKGVCSQCQSVGMLESYDTTLFFIVFFVPLIPLSRKRILESCPHCKRHRVMKLADWDKAKTKVFDDLAGALSSGTNVDQAIRDSLGAASFFQDEKILEQVAGAAAARNDPAVQSELGNAYAYFARWPDAEGAYRKSLSLADTPETKERVAHMLLKQGKPDEALPYIKHIFENKLADKAWLPFVLIDAYQAQGRHTDALAMMDARDAAFSQFKDTSEYKKQRQTSVKNESSGKPIKSSILSEPKGLGYSDVSPWRTRLPRLIGPLVILGLLAWYFGAAWHIGNHRQVYLFNGTPKAYSIKVNGQTHKLEPNRPHKLDVPEGEVLVENGDVDFGPPQKCRVETSFWARPFAKQMFVINPDRLALLTWEEVGYAENPGRGAKQPQFKLHTGELLTAFNGIDYEWENWPASVPVKKGQTVTKRRVGAEFCPTTMDRMRIAIGQLNTEQQVESARKLVRLDPNDGTALNWLAGIMKPEALLEEVKPRLADRPLRVDWHRMHQSYTEIVKPDADLRPEYRKLVDEEKRSGDSLYLLGRIEEPEAAKKLYEEAVAAVPPSAAALSGMAYRQVCSGDAENGVKLLKRAKELQPNDMRVQHFFKEALLAAGKYDELADAAANEDIWLSFSDRILACAGKNDLPGANAVIDQVLSAAGIQPGNPQGDQFRRPMNLTLACAQLALDKYLTLASLEAQAFELAYLKGKYQEAIKHIGEVNDATRGSREMSFAVGRHGLVYLAAIKANDRGTADEQLRKIDELLSKTGREERRFADILTGRKPFDFEQVRIAPVDAAEKRILLLILAQQHPEQAAELEKLADKLDFRHDSVSLCKKYITGK